MANVFINLDYTGWFALFAARNRGRGITRDGKRLLLTDSNRKTVMWWHRKIIPRHFDVDAAGRYHYQKRKKTYSSIKVALASGKSVFVNGKLLEAENILKAGRVDIVRGGKTEQKAESHRAVVATPRQAVIVMRLPSFVVNRRSNRPDMAREITSRTKAETAQLVRIWKKTFLAGVRVYGSSIVAVRRRFNSRSI